MGEKKRIEIERKDERQREKRRETKRKAERVWVGTGRHMGEKKRDREKNIVIIIQTKFFVLYKYIYMYVCILEKMENKIKMH